MSRRSRRRLSEEDRALWQRVIETAVPLKPDAPRPIAELPEAVAPPLPSKEPQAQRFPRFQVGQAAGTVPSGDDLAKPIAEHLSEAAPRMDRKRFGKLRRGKIQPEARLDLHGMTLAQAHPALNRFILDSHAQGRRLVLVITGKGKRRENHDPIPVRTGVLRHQVPHWLHTPPLSQAVLQVTPAHLKHGGEGAYYVYLRRAR